MKVLHVINNLGGGGAGNLLKSSLPIMKKQGVDVEVLLLFSDNNIHEKELMDHGIKLHKIRLKNIYSPMHIFKIKPYLNKYDIVHTHLFPTQYWVSLAKKLFLVKTPIITTEHSTNNRRRNHFLFRLLDKFIYSSYEKIICISEGARLNLIKWQPKLESKAIVINNGINLEKYENAKVIEKKELNNNIKIRKDIKLILMASRFTESKDHETLVKSLTLLKDNYHLILAGEGPLKNNIRDLCEELDVSQRVHFLGYRTDIERILKVVDVYVQSSHWEGFGLAVVEAMASGLPVIASDVPGLSEVVEDGGILFPKGDYVKLAKIIETLMSSSEKRTEISRMCKNKSKEFSVDIMVKKYVHLYYDLLSK